jgi:hypothetical protein
VKTIERLEIHAGVHAVERDGRRRRHARAPERRHRDLDVARDRDLEVLLACARGLRARLELGALVAELERLTLDAGHEFGARVGLDERVHGVEALERVLAVEHAGRIERVAVHERGTTTEVAVDGRATDEHRDAEAHAMQLVDDDGHLLARRDEQRRQADRGRIELPCLVDDGLHRHLLAEIEHGVAVVREDRLDQVLADVVHVAEHRGEHDAPLGHIGALLEVALELRDGLLHDLGALQHERQDELTRTELVTDLLHGRQQHGIEHGHRVLMLDRLIDEALDTRGLAMQDLMMQPLLDGHARFGGLVLAVARIGRTALEVRDVRGERLRLAREDQILGETAIVGRQFGDRDDVGGIHDRHVEPGLHAVVQEHAVEDRARLLAEAERDVRDAERGRARRAVPA